MVLNFLKKMFASEDAAPPKPTLSANPEENLVEFVRFVICELVDAPDKVTVVAKESGDRLAVEITCEKQDIGKVIGRRGKTISAIRALATGAARRCEKRVTVDVLD